MSATPKAALPGAFFASYPGNCLRCDSAIEVGDLIRRDGGSYVHDDCPDAADLYTPTLDERYNAMCQLLDRIMTGSKTLRATGGAASFIAETVRTSDRSTIQFDHAAIARWARNGIDRTALTLALNLHELGHVFDSPAHSVEELRERSRDEKLMFSALEDQRQEMLSALRWPKAVDYLRFMNARALARCYNPATGAFPPNPGLFLLYYGRRHLFPASVNAALREIAVETLGEHATWEAERLITEFMLLMLPEEKPRSWEIVARLLLLCPGGIYGNLNGVMSEDLRHDCVPKGGRPKANAKQRQQLQKRLKAVLEREPKTPEPAPDPVAASPTEEKPQAAPDEAEEESEDEASEGGGSEKGEGEEKEGEGATAQEPKADDASSEEAETGDAETGGDAKTEDSAKEDETDWPAGAEGEDEEEEEDDELAGDTDEDWEGDGDDDYRGTPVASAGGGDGETPGKGADLSDSQELEPPQTRSADDTLEALAEDALDNLAEEIKARHQALRITNADSDLGGKKRAGLISEDAGAARQIARLFRDINSDLRPQMHRNQKRGRLDVRRVSVALANNSPRMFKRRQQDLTKEAAMGVHVMIDVSGSMFPDRVGPALSAGFALARGIELAGHYAKVTTFDSRDKVQKNWLDRAYSMTRKHGGGGTSPLAAISKARPDFRRLSIQEDVHNAILIIITDGSWYIYPDWRGFSDLRKDGVYVIQIGIGHVPSDKPGAWKTLSTPDVQGLAGAMKAPLKEIALEIARDVRKKVSA